MKNIFRRRIASAKKQIGFSLLEVMVALVVSNVALLGLVAGELKSLQYAQNSYQYTVSLIHANNAVEHILNDICKLKSNNTKFNDAYVETLAPAADSGYTLTFDNIEPADANDVFTESFLVHIGWVDERMNDHDQSLNQVTLLANFPTVAADCNVDG